MEWEFIESGTCCKCNKFFKNNKRRIHIVKNINDGKIYCKSCNIELAIQNDKDSKISKAYNRLVNQ